MTTKTKGGGSRPASPVRKYEPEWFKAIPVAERERWKTLPPLERCAEAVKAQSNITAQIDGASAIGVHRKLYAGFVRLYSERPDVVGVFLNFGDKKAAASAILTYADKAGRLGLWGLLDRIDDRFTAHDFGQLYLSRPSSVVVPALSQLPSVMLCRAARIGSQLTNAFLLPRGKPAHPIPSAFFPGIARRLNQKILDAGLETDVELLSELATYQDGDQDIFWNLETPSGIKFPDRAAARRYVSTPQWRRPLLDYSVEAKEVWDLFLVMADFYEMARSTKKPEEWTPEEWRSTQRTLGLTYQTFAMAAFSKRWPMAYQVIWGYGKALQHGPVPTDEERRVPPWKT